MADHGDETAEFLLNRTFNGYNARSIIQFIFRSQIEKNSPENSDRKSNEIGNHTLDYCRDFESFKELEGFETEKQSSFDYAALKSYVLKENYKIDCVQVKDSILFRTIDYAKISNKEVQQDIMAKIGVIAKDKNKVADIVTAAKISEQKIESELFLKLPYSHSDGTRKRVTERAKSVSKSKPTPKRQKKITREFAQSISK